MEIFERLRNAFPKLTRKQKIVAELLLNDAQNLSFMTIRELAKEANVSTTTILRFVESLGFKRYKDMCLAFNRGAEYSTPGMEKLKEGSVSHSFHEDVFFDQIVAFEAENISVIPTPFLRNNFRKTIEIIRLANRVFIMGARSSYSLAYYLGFLLQQFMENVTYTSSNADNIYQKISLLGKEDVAIVFSFPHYTRATVQISRIMHERDVQIIAVTDGSSSPLIKYTQFPLFCPNTSSFYSYTAAISLCNMLILGLKESLDVSFKNRFDDFSEILKEGEVYI